MTSPAYFYNDAQFRAAFPAFADQIAYPQSTLSMYFDTSGLYVANSNFGFLARAGATLHCLYLLTAHLAQLGSQIAQGNTGGVIITSTIDKITVGLQEAVLHNQWQYWLQSTAYGQQLLALLQAQSVGGLYTPGGIGRAGFRV